MKVNHLQEDPQGSKNNIKGKTNMEKHNGIIKSQ